MVRRVTVPHYPGVSVIGSAGHYAICDVCGGKFRAKTLQLVTDKYSTQNGLLVCKADRDKTNPQMHLKAYKVRSTPNPKTLRAEQPYTYMHVDSLNEIENGATTYPSGNAPGTPSYLVCAPTADSTVALQWVIDKGVGSGPIIGYKIERESPVGGGFTTIVANNGSVAQYYEDLTTSSLTQYNYRVSAINDYGTSSASNEAHTTTL